LPQPQRLRACIRGKSLLPCEDEVKATDFHIKPLAAVAKERLDRAIWQLESAGLIIRSNGRRPDAAGRMRDQVIWRVDRHADPRIV
jgi:hypothetical protein